MWVDIANGNFPKVSYRIGEKEESQLYFTADNIYPRYPVFMQSYGSTTTCNPKESYFSKRIESVRKDIERAFGILQARFAVLTKPSLYWQLKDLKNEVLCCIILHNMILQDEKTILSDCAPSTSFLQSNSSNCNAIQRGLGEFPLSAIVMNLQQSQGLNKFLTLRDSLTEHLYEGRWSTML